MRPVIGITPLMDTKLDSYWMLPDYMQAVQQAGGLPLMLPFQYDDESINQMVELCDGLVFTGGEDIDTSWYHAERLPVCGESIAVRDELEIRLLRAALAAKKPVLCIFAAVFAVGCFLAGLSKNLGVYVIGAVCVGAGYSVCESVSSAVLSELDAEKGARYINLSQALLSLGAVISPFLVQWLQKSRHASWRLPFLICAAAYTLLALLLLLTVFPKRQTVTQREAKARTNFFASRAFRLLFFSILLYVGLENGISYFAESLFSVRLSAGDLAAAAISAYWIGMTVSRMLFSAVLRNPKKTLIGCFLASAAFLLVLAVSKNPTVSLVCCFAAGFSYGPIWSTLVAQATGLFPEAGAGAAGVMSAGCGIGGIVYPVLMGAACEGMGLGGAFGLLAATAAAGAVLCARLQTNKRKTGASALGMR